MFFASNPLSIRVHRIIGWFSHAIVSLAYMALGEAAKTKTEITSSSGSPWRF